jgi:hypothetical protein
MLIRESLLVVNHVYLTPLSETSLLQGVPPYIYSE